MLDYRIYTFISLCETRSYTKTAEQLHISQPSVSQHIKALEQHYGCDLFYFEGRNLKLTKEGRYLYQKEVGIMTNEKEIESYIEQMANGKHLRIGMTPSVSESFVPKYLAAYIRKNAEIHFQFLVDDMQLLRGNLAHSKSAFRFCLNPMYGKTFRIGGCNACRWMIFFSGEIFSLYT